MIRRGDLPYHIFYTPVEGAHMVLFKESTSSVEVMKRLREGENLSRRRQGLPSIKIDFDPAAQKELSKNTSIAGELARSVGVEGVLAAVNLARRLVIG